MYVSHNVSLGYLYSSNVILSSIQPQQVRKVYHYGVMLTRVAYDPLLLYYQRFELDVVLSVTTGVHLAAYWEHRSRRILIVTILNNSNPVNTNRPSTLVPPGAAYNYATELDLGCVASTQHVKL